MIVKLTGDTNIPNADAAPEPGGIIISEIPSFLATFAACTGPAPPIQTIE